MSANEMVLQNLDKTKYKTAAVGACPGRQPNQQFTTYHIALLRGCDVDKPRNLAKSVTVE